MRIGHLRSKARIKKPRRLGESSGLRGGGYLLFHFRSIIGVARFNFSVRNGKRWSPCAIATLVRLQQALRCADSLIARLSVREGRRFSLPSCAAALCGVKKESGSPSCLPSVACSALSRGFLCCRFACAFSEASPNRLQELLFRAARCRGPVRPDRGFVGLAPRKGFG